MKRPFRAQLFGTSPPEKRAREHRRLVAEAMVYGRADAIIATDRDGIIRLWNPGAERLFG